MSEVRKIDDLKDLLVNSAVLEEVFGVGDRQIRKLADQGIIEKDSHGKYKFLKSVKSYILTIKVANRVSAGIKVDDDLELDLDGERAAHERIKRQITEIKLQLIKGQVHKSEDVEAVMSDMHEKFKQKMTALPSKLAKKLEGKNRTDIQKILKREIEAALVELASYNPADFYSDEHIEIDDDTISGLGVDDYE